jgi:hypothetical protein
MSKNVYIIRPGCVEFVDLCRHEKVNRSDFFNEAGLKTLRHYGLILELPDLVKILSNDDITDSTECEGMVVPRSCVVDIIYYKEDLEASAPILDQDDSVN